MADKPKIWSARKTKQEIDKLEHKLIRQQMEHKKDVQLLSDAIVVAEMECGLTKESHRLLLSRCPVCKEHPVWDAKLEKWTHSKCVTDLYSEKIGAAWRTSYTSKEWLTYIDAVTTKLWKLEMEEQHGNTTMG